MSFSKKQNTKKKVGESKKVSTKKSQGLMAFVGTKKSVKRETIPELIVDKPKKAQKINKLDRWIYGTQLVEQNKIDPVEVYNTPDPTPEPEQIIQPKKMKREKPVLTPTKKAVAIKGETITLEKPTFPKKYKDFGSQITIDLDEENNRVLTAKPLRSQYSPNMSLLIGKNGMLNVDYVKNFPGYFDPVMVIRAGGFIPKDQFKVWMRVMRDHNAKQNREGKNKYVFVVDETNLEDITEDLRSAGIPLGHNNKQDTIKALEDIPISTRNTNLTEVDLEVDAKSAFVNIRADQDELLKRIGEYLYNRGVVVQEEFIGRKKEDFRDDEARIYTTEGKRKATRTVVYELIKPERAKSIDGKEYIVGYRIPVNMMYDYSGEIATLFNTPLKIVDHRDWAVKEPRPIYIDDKFTGFREYQLEAINEVLWKGSGLIQAATGAGKTEIGIGVLAGLNKDAVWLTHRNNLVLQSEKRIEDRLGMDVGKVTGQDFEIVETPGMDVNVLSVQSAASAIKALEEHERGERILKPKDLAKKKAIVELLQRSDVEIFDEAHHLVANSFKRIIEQNESAPHKIGLTATPYNDTELDRTTIEMRIGQPLVKITASELIDKGFLAQPDIKQLEVPAHPDIDEMEAILRDLDPRDKGVFYKQVERKAIVENAEVNALIGRQIANHQQKQESNLVLVNRVDHAIILQDFMRLSGADMSKVVVNTGDAVPDAQKRKEIIDDFREGRYSTMIATTQIAGEGVDIPKIDNVFIVDGGQSYISTMQKVGRGLRRPKGSSKVKVQVWDYAHPEPFLKNHAIEREKIFASEPAFKFDRVPLREIGNFIN